MLALNYAFDNCFKNLILLLLPSTEKKVLQLFQDWILTGQWGEKLDQ